MLLQDRTKNQPDDKIRLNPGGAAVTDQRHKRGPITHSTHWDWTQPSDLRTASTSNKHLGGGVDSYFKMSAASDEGAGAEHHEADDDLQDDSGQRRRALHPADPGPGGQQILPHTELSALCQLH